MQDDRIPQIPTVWQAEAEALRASGLTIKEIARHVGKSKSAVWRALHPDRALAESRARKDSKREWERKKRAEARIRAGIIEPDPHPGTLWLRDAHGRVIGQTIVDLEDWHRFKDHRLHLKTGYAAFCKDGATVYLHREILGLQRGESLKERQADHINRYKLDNRRANLRIVSAEENSANRGGKFAKAA